MQEVVQGSAPQLDLHEVLSISPAQGQIIAMGSIISSPRATVEGCRKRQGRDLFPLLLCVWGGWWVGVCLKQNRTLDVSFPLLMSSLPPSPSLLPGSLSSWTWVTSLGLFQLHLAPSPLGPTSACLNQRPQLLLGSPFAQWEPVFLGSGNLFLCFLAVSEW